MAELTMLCEADEIAYRCAFACQKQAYIYKGKQGVIDLEATFTKTDIINDLKNNDKEILGIDYELEPYKLIDTEDKAIETLEKYVEFLYQVTVPLDEGTHTIKDLKFYLSPSDHSNFRYKLANTAGSKGEGYKAGRGEKPHYLELIRELLVSEYQAVEIKGYEADDALGIYSNGNDYCIMCHQDKDIDMIPGWHYNHVTQEIYYVNNQLGTLELQEKVNKSGKSYKLVGRGLVQFYAQLLQGDSVDNIPGIKGLGAKGIYSKLKHLNSEAELFETVREEYIKFYTLEHADRILNECADLLWICRVEGEIGSIYLKSKGFY